MLLTFVFRFGVNHTTPSSTAASQPPPATWHFYRNQKWNVAKTSGVPVKISKNEIEKQIHHLHSGWGFLFVCGLLLLRCFCFVGWFVCFYSIPKQWMKTGKPWNTEILTSKQTENTTSCSDLKLTQSLLQNQSGSWEYKPGVFSWFLYFRLLGFVGFVLMWVFLLGWGGVVCFC